MRSFLKVNSKTDNFKGIPLSTHRNRSKLHDQPVRSSLESKPVQTTNSLHLSKSATGHLDLISKARIAKYANTMVPLQDLLADTKETAESLEFGLGDAPRETESDSLVAQLEVATDAVSNDVPQLPSKETKEEDEKDCVEMHVAEPTVTKSPPLEESPSVALHSIQLPKSGGDEDLHKGYTEEGLVISKDYAVINEKEKIPSLNVMSYEDFTITVDNSAEHPPLNKAIRKNNAASSGNVYHHPVGTQQVLNNPEVIRKRVIEPVSNPESVGDIESERLGYRADDSEGERSDVERGDTDDNKIEDIDDVEIEDTDDLEPCGTDSSQTAPEDEHFSDHVCEHGSGEKTDESIKEESSIPPLNFARTKFDPQALFERLQAENRYKKDPVWVNDHNVMSCPVQPFLQRLSMSGEMFDVP